MSVVPTTMVATTTASDNVLSRKSNLGPPALAQTMW
jgi:hypothetical protein